MIIFEDNENKSIDNVTILLNRGEMHQLLGYARQLLEKNPLSDHYHLSSDDYQKEITLCMYGPENMQSFSPEIQN